MTTLAARAMPRRSRWIPWVFVGGFLLVVAVNATMIFFAVNSFTGLTTTEPYTKGLRFNEQIREAEVSDRLGWHVAARFTPIEERRGTVEVMLTDRNGAALTGAEVSVTFTRPVERDRDFTITLAARGGGRYAGEAEFPLSGLWDATYRAERGTEILKARDRLQVR